MCARLFCIFYRIRPKRKRFFCVKWGRMIEETEKMDTRIGKLLVRYNKLLCIYGHLLKNSGKLIEFCNRFEYNEV